MLSLPLCSIHVILLFARKSAVGLPAIMSCIVDGLVSTWPLTTPRPFFGPSSLFFLCVICILLGVPYLRSQCPRHLEAPVPTATCYSTVAPSHYHLGRWSVARPRAFDFLLLYRCMLVWVSAPYGAACGWCLASHAPKEHTTRRHRAPARPPTPLMPNLSCCLGRLVFRS